MYEPVRGGTRGGQAEFKWSDVSADKDREHYLGHSINAPTGRWQKNKDVHWYARDKDEDQAARDEEIRRIKEAEAEALAAALGFASGSKPGVPGAPSAPGTGANAIGVAPKPTLDTDALDPDKAREKEERKRRKAERKEEKRLKKAARRARRGGRGAESGEDSADGDRDSGRRDGRRGERDWSRERRERTPPPSARGADAGGYGQRERERERERDRRSVSLETPGVALWQRVATLELGRASSGRWVIQLRRRAPVD
ncbi:hypothetical protein CERSUDRAFT_126057 [Gelatoporia subvermispora B]|uniref:Multiple myeloma tumor-associated protein 2-like N-terminal domain-containing protein n=1 Tax=Ceriporiopsis subvermispora (strain B) TaxID=914234 RepID=M2QNV4_CERS8|nr:hypothetical protein CERSUDRAFT_126057 [Gelatoporia subvermispora B]